MKFNEITRFFPCLKSLSLNNNKVECVSNLFFLFSKQIIRHPLSTTQVPLISEEMLNFCYGQVNEFRILIVSDAIKVVYVVVGICGWFQTEFLLLN